MSAWFQDRRQEFIAATLKTFGQIRRDDLMRQFDISMQQASTDISRFMKEQSGFAAYDVSAKAYVIVEPAPESPLAKIADSLREKARLEEERT